MCAKLACILTKMFHRHKEMMERLAGNGEHDSTKEETHILLNPNSPSEKP